MRLKELHAETHPDYPFAAQLYVEAFPRTERREPQEWFTVNKAHPEMHVFVAVVDTDDDKAMPVGMVCYWHFAEFIYVEHLAVSPQQRQQGYGGEILHLLKGEKPVVLEVEPPVDETTRLRIAFYRKNGLDICSCAYVQPPYTAELPPLELHLMTDRSEWLESHFNEVKPTLYTQVYGVEANAEFVV